MSQKQLMLGNQAIARGLYEAGCTVVSSYPGTPSTEITEYAAGYDFYTEWAPNEKVALEVAMGASFAGGRAMSAMKHVGLNVAADPLFTLSYMGVTGGLVICVADDPGMHSSQNEQDSRHYAEAAKIMMLEPSDSQECKDFVAQAFSLSEEFDTPVLIRLTTRVAHSQSAVEVAEPEPYTLKPYKKNPEKLVMMPQFARGRHVFVEERLNRQRAFAETTPLNKVEYFSKKIGVITSGISYLYAREALGENASYLKLGMVYPLPEQKIREFAASVERCYIIEELDPIFERFCRSLGIEVIGKSEFSLLGEYSDKLIRKVVLGESTDFVTRNEEIPGRPPVMCAGCPHRGTFYVLNKMKLIVNGDIGCYTLGSLPPTSAMDISACMGAGVAMTHGMAKANPELKAVAVIGDSTFMHSGMTGLANIIYNNGNSTVLVLDNSITGMTGHQENPTTGKTLKGEPAPAIDIAKLCEAMGAYVLTADPFDLKGLEASVKEAIAHEGASVVVVKRPCALLKGVKFGQKPYIDTEKCKKCKLCLKAGCPAISNNNGVMEIDQNGCVGCGFCQGICGFGAIVTPSEGGK